ncbi:hypothetical protein F4680DRAFT_13424 [Xylaria scruposa]|nr:hypothetical protein F4680DRAFT_13424 [Xylaria scruposa]
MEPIRSTPSSSVSSEDVRRLNFLSRAGLSPPVKVPCLVKLPLTDFNWSLPQHADPARALLVQYRTTGPERKPEEEKHDFFRLPHQKKRARDEASWTFKKREVAHTFNNLLLGEQLPPAGVAQALLSHVSLTSINELWCHFIDRKLEKSMDSFFKRGGVSSVPEITWLDRVARQDNADYIRLMCQAGVDQEALDRAFSIALARRSMEVMEMLLTFGATVSACQDEICKRIQLDDVPLAKLLLSAPPAAVTLSTWRRCFSEEIERGGKHLPSILLLCVSQRPSVICGPLLVKAFEAKNIQAAAALLAFASSENGLDEFSPSACSLVSDVQNADSRHNFFALLADAGLVVDCMVLRKELIADIKARHFPLVRVLVDAGVALDVEPYNSIAYIVSEMDIEMLEWVQGGKWSKPAALLNSAPEMTSEPLLLRLVTILMPHGLEGKPLDIFLVRAARKQYAELTRLLVDLEASVEYDAACAIKAAVSNADSIILDILLQGSCSPNALSSALPIAMRTQPRPTRHYIVSALVSKGVLEQELGISLQALVAETGDIDLDLVRLLVEHGALVEGVGNDTSNALLQVARRCNPAALKLLCSAKPELKTFSKAVPIAFEARDTCGHDAMLETLRLLLKHGANGTPVHQTLLAAVKEGHRQDVVGLLLKHGADANFHDGAPFDLALKAANLSLLELLCLDCPPNKASIASVLYRAIDPLCYNPDALELLLGSAKFPGAALDELWDADKLHGNPNLNTIVPCFLRHGLDVNLQDGTLLCFAVEEVDVNLLAHILSFRPSTTSLTEAFKLTPNIEARRFQIEMMSMLLERAQSVEIGQSKGLLQQTYPAFEGDFEGLRLLLGHKATVDFDDGIAVQVAASAGHIRVLDYLLDYMPTISTLQRACLAAASTTLSSDQKNLIFNSLLNARNRELTEANRMSHLLAKSVRRLPSHVQLPVLLISRGVKIQFHTLMVAMRTSSPHLFEALVDMQDPTTITEIFREAKNAAIEAKRKYWVYKCLLGRDIPSKETSIALIDCLESNDFGDLDIPKLLLEHGADVGHRKCAVFHRALSAGSLIVVKLLSQYLPDDDTACVAFDLALKATKLDLDVRAGVYFCLLQWNISAPLVYSALIDSLKSPDADNTVVKLLLDKGANPNQDTARCFVLAAAAGKEIIYRALSKYANLSLVLRALLGHFHTEWEVLLWFNICLEEQHHSATIDDHNLLYQCMHRFPAGNELLRVILGRGVSPAALKPMVLCGGIESEQCTPLIWALFAGIENATILAILTFAGHQALPMYSTPRTQVTASFLCLLDKKRTPILSALLNLDRKRTLECSTPASTFQYYGTKTHFSDNNSGLPAELPLRTACMMLGNFDAYRTLNCEEISNNGLLHAAAFLALPRFVAWLLTFHDPDEKVPEEYDQMVPLALACGSKPSPWCKIAREEISFATRRKQCITILAPVTNLNWRYREKTVLHIALENGLEVTRNIFEVLKVCQDPKRNDNYLHRDKDGIEYSLDEYVLQRLKGIDDKEKEALVIYLRENKIQSRYFRRVMPGDGVQPKGYHGLPPAYGKAWKAHEERVRNLQLESLNRRNKASNKIPRQSDKTREYQKLTAYNRYRTS